MERYLIESRRFGVVIRHVCCEGEEARSMEQVEKSKEKQLRIQLYVMHDVHAPD